MRQAASGNGHLSSILSCDGRVGGRQQLAVETGLGIMEGGAGSVCDKKDGRRLRIVSRDVN